MQAFSKATSYSTLPINIHPPQQTYRYQPPSEHVSSPAHVDPCCITPTPGGYVVELHPQTNTARVKVTRDQIHVDFQYHVLEADKEGVFHVVSANQRMGLPRMQRKEISKDRQVSLKLKRRSLGMGAAKVKLEAERAAAEKLAAVPLDSNQLEVHFVYQFQPVAYFAFFNYYEAPNQQAALSHPLPQHTSLPASHIPTCTSVKDQSDEPSISSWPPSNQTMITTDAQTGPNAVTMRVNVLLSQQQYNQFAKSLRYIACDLVEVITKGMLPAEDAQQVQQQVVEQLVRRQDSLLDLLGVLTEIRAGWDNANAFVGVEEGQANFEGALFYLHWILLFGVAGGVATARQGGAHGGAELAGREVGDVDLITQVCVFERLRSRVKSWLSIKMLTWVEVMEGSCQEGDVGRLGPIEESVVQTLEGNPCLASEGCFTPKQASQETMLGDKEYYCVMYTPNTPMQLTCLPLQTPQCSDSNSSNKSSNYSSKKGVVVACCPTINAALACKLAICDTLAFQFVGQHVSMMSNICHLIDARAGNDCPSSGAGRPSSAPSKFMKFASKILTRSRKSLPFGCGKGGQKQQDTRGLVHPATALMGCISPTTVDGGADVAAGIRAGLELDISLERTVGGRLSSDSGSNVQSTFRMSSGEGYNVSLGLEYAFVDLDTAMSRLTSKNQDCIDARTREYLTSQPRILPKNVAVVIGDKCWLNVWDDPKERQHVESEVACAHESDLHVFVCDDDIRLLHQDRLDAGDSRGPRAYLPSSPDLLSQLRTDCVEHPSKVGLLLYLLKLDLTEVLVLGLVAHQEKWGSHGVWWSYFYALAGMVAGGKLRHNVKWGHGTSSADALEVDMQLSSGVFIGVAKTKVLEPDTFRMAEVFHKHTSFDTFTEQEVSKGYRRVLDKIQRDTRNRKQIQKDKSEGKGRQEWGPRGGEAEQWVQSDEEQGSSSNGASSVDSGRLSAHAGQHSPQGHQSSTTSDHLHKTPGHSGGGGQWDDVSTSSWWEASITNLRAIVKHWQGLASLQASKNVAGGGMVSDLCNGLKSLVNHHLQGAGGGDFLFDSGSVSGGDDTQVSSLARALLGHVPQEVGRSEPADVGQSEITSAGYGVSRVDFSSGERRGCTTARGQLLTLGEHVPFLLDCVCVSYAACVMYNRSSKFAAWGGVQGLDIKMSTQVQQRAHKQSRQQEQQMQSQNRNLFNDDGANTNTTSNGDTSNATNGNAGQGSQVAQTDGSQGDSDDPLGILGPQQGGDKLEFQHIVTVHRDKLRAPLVVKRSGNFLLHQFIQPENLMREMEDTHEEPNVDCESVNLYGCGFGFKRKGGESVLSLL